MALDTEAQIEMLEPPEATNPKQRRRLQRLMKNNVSKPDPKPKPTQAKHGSTLFVFTVDGDDREDGSVYYASYVLVDAHQNGDPDRWLTVRGLVDAFDESGEEVPYLIRKLKNAGIRATWFHGNSINIYALGEV